VILGPGEGHAHYSARGSEMFFKATAELDGGDLSVMERTLPPGGRRPPPHRHTNCSEAYFVLDGVVSIIVDGRELTVGREGFVLVPRGTAHTFGNASAEPARLLVIHAPAADAYFAGLHELWNRPAPPAPDEERALMARFGMDPALSARHTSPRPRLTRPRPTPPARVIAVGATGALDMHRWATRPQRRRRPAVIGCRP
jgi:mannose-6-phosphate isomerase-like protein (cupin superfamily)